MRRREKLLKYCRRFSFADPRMKKKKKPFTFNLRGSTSFFFRKRLLLEKKKKKEKSKINIRFVTMLLIFVRRYYYYWVRSLYIINKLLALGEKYLNKTSALNVANRSVLIL